MATDKPNRVFTYEGKAITVEYELARCIHAAECVHGLEAVFDPQRKPWIDPDAAEPAEVAAVIGRCPTGALRFSSADGDLTEPAPERNTVKVAPDGPLYVRGRLRIRRADGSETEEYRAALCRCGESAHKPYCDNSHRDCEFVDPGALGEGRLRLDEDAEPSSELQVTVAANGPLILAGDVELESADGSQTMTGNRGALCRCGASEKKPYCDGTHKGIGFTAE